MSDTLSFVWTVKPFSTNVYTNSKNYWFLFGQVWQSRAFTLNCYRVFTFDRKICAKNDNSFYLYHSILFKFVFRDRLPLLEYIINLFKASYKFSIIKIKESAICRDCNFFKASGFFGTEIIINNEIYLQLLLQYKTQSINVICGWLSNFAELAC